MHRLPGAASTAGDQPPELQDLTAATKAAGAFSRKFGDEFPTAGDASARDRTIP